MVERETPRYAARVSGVMMPEGRLVVLVSALAAARRLGMNNQLPRGSWSDGRLVMVGLSPRSVVTVGLEGGMDPFAQQRLSQGADATGSVETTELGD
jgi:hypothetical protein